MTAIQRRESQRPMTHDDVIQMMTVVNVPRSSSVGPAWKRVTGNTVKRSTVPRISIRCRQTTATYDDNEAARTTKYWESFAREATRELLKDVIRPEDDNPQHRIMYSGRIGIEPKYPPKIAEDDESICTDLSLLTCSELAGRSERSERRGRRNRRTIEPDVDSKTNWAEVVKESYGGVLGRMLEKDAGSLHVFTNGSSSGGYGVLNKANISKLFSEEEQALLIRSAYVRGIKADKKSASTENIVSVFGSGGQPTVQDVGGFRKRMTTSRDTQQLLGSPDVGATRRSLSVPNEIHAAATKSRPNSEKRTRPRSIFGADEPLSTGYPVAMAKRDSEGDYARHVHAQIYSTVTALDRIAGLGDNTTDLNPIPEERGLYTDTDYGHVPRYPQNIRVAPQLVHVITSEVKRRVTQPRHYELRQQDVYRFDRMQPSLDRASRNLFIFNWLAQLNERHFRSAPFPERHRAGSQADDDITEIVITGNVRSPSTETVSDDGQFDNVSGVSSDVGYDDAGDVDSYGPAVGSLSDQSL
ncbi:hypothetical protein LSH36_452g01009 [Paralvinella palmiformis]|uniref:Uncharacterized protein n=1 Tax=Paralvinella palmiformis TaxID=53620 RepID=A0AAD9JBK0_9ANNE|nr:hypothetical protein LSH36_452g01009 [Paralvinella palmiformis]